MKTTFLATDTPDTAPQCHRALRFGNQLDRFRSRKGAINVLKTRSIHDSFRCRRWSDIERTCRRFSSFASRCAIAVLPSSPKARLNSAPCPPKRAAIVLRGLVCFKISQHNFHAHSAGPSLSASVSRRSRGYWSAIRS